MDYRSALEALRRPLEFVYRDSFANLESVKGLGESLKTAASQLSRHLAAPRSQHLTAWARDVARWDVLPRPERERLVAAGLRWCHVAANEAPKEAPRPPPRATVTREGSATLGTPLEGLPMGTRSGSFDPEIVLFLLKQGLSPGATCDPS